MKNILKLIPCLVLLLPAAAVAQHKAAVREYEKTYTTYPFSRPDPVPSLNRIYPYFRYDGYTDKPVQRPWKVVELENDYIRVLILPEIGGKIWTAVNRKTGKPFIYDNGVVKFRDVAMRGPWTSGGLEMNFGIIGHTPTVATPVDYLTQTGADGSAHCIISALDLLTGTRWSVDISLPADKAYFSTKVCWHNASPLDQPYYSWMNLGEKVGGGLEYIGPGTHYLGHDGSVHSWPYDSAGHHLSVYDRNDFGSYKSYHVTGTYASYFGAFWREENAGMIHYAEREDKIGKKVWIWGLSPQGMIWEKLLTDESGQYTELQSGRLYNQNAEASSLTPFKQVSFMPYNTDTWTEYWYPFGNTGGVTHADLNGVLNVRRTADSLIVLFSPVSPVNDTLRLLDETGRTLYRQKIELLPLQSYRAGFALEKERPPARLALAGSVVPLENDTARQLSRPLYPYPGFDYESAYGLYLLGRDLARARDYAGAEKKIRASLAKEPAFMPALTEMSRLQYRKMRYDSAFYFARLALSIDTYDPAANYYYGLAALKLGKWYDAADGFQVAAITPDYRAAAFTELSRMQLRKGDYKAATRYAARSLAGDTRNITALQIAYLCARLTGGKEEMERREQEIRELDPLNHFIRFEKYRRLGDETARKEFTDLVRDELPQATYLDLAAWYAGLGMNSDSRAVLETAPVKDDEMLYWLAYLHKDDGEGRRWLEAAVDGNPRMVFPFRPESVPVMKWALRQTDDWKPRYYLALITAFRGDTTRALRLLEEAAPADFAPFYVVRARLRDSSETGKIRDDLAAAAAMDKNDWRYGQYLAGFLLKQGHYERAVTIMAPYYKKDPGNYLAGMLYARCLMAAGNYAGAEEILDGIHVLPHEGATDSHALYEETKLMRALEALQKRRYKQALQKMAEARQWPERLGVGKPYPALIDDSLEDKLEKLVHDAMKTRKAEKEQIASFREKVKAIAD